MLKALDCKIGALFSVSDVVAFKRYFYQIRAVAKKQGDTTFDNLSVITPSEDQDSSVWIVKKEESSGKKK